ncbi:FUSC family protein [Haematobacter genomosp. 1]|uniref:FUSC family protein n=1 Tax=Haematobacter genomosp. 1 TaxID=366618 RepID=UPI0015C5D5A4|nr:FUSC family protein [Haematobacter genomosp. 1]
MARRGIAARVLGRWRITWLDALESAAGATLAWVIAHGVFGHDRPVFAAVSAIVCLSPALPSHARQAIGLMSGVVTGTVVGELGLLLVPDTYPVLRLAIVSFVAMMVATSYGQPAVVPIQAGVSALLVLAMGPQTAGLSRLIDVATGTGVGLLFSQVLFTRDPVTLVQRSAAAMTAQLAAGLRQLGGAIGKGDVPGAEAALKVISQTHGPVVALGESTAAARQEARWSLRGRLSAERVSHVTEIYDSQSIRLYACALLMAEAGVDLLRKEGAAPGVAGMLSDLASGLKTGISPRLPQGVDPGWEPMLIHLLRVRSAMLAFRASDPTEGVIPAGPDDAPPTA